jgi:hypothetical protein
VELFKGGGGKDEGQFGGRNRQRFCGPELTTAFLPLGSDASAYLFKRIGGEIEEGLFILGS